MDGRMVNDSNAVGHGETLQRTQQRSCMNDDNRSLLQLSRRDSFIFRRDAATLAHPTSGAVFSGITPLAKESGISGQSRSVKLRLRIWQEDSP